MNPLALIFGFGLLAFSVFFVASPLRFIDVPKQSVRREMKMTTANRRQAVLLALRDLDFDYQANKVADEDYHTLRAELTQEAAEIIQGQEQQKDDAIEALIQSRRKAAAEKRVVDAPPSQKVKAEKLCQNCNSTLLEGSKFCSKCGTSVEEVACPKCGETIHIDDRFCPSCGTAVDPAAQLTLAKGE